jgi:predicted nuclease of predicted toxin-antitoxin system
MTQTFRDAGYEALRLTGHTSADSIDSVVTSQAQELDSIPISLNGDFADIAAYPPANYNGWFFKLEVIWNSSRGLWQH